LEKISKNIVKVVDFFVKNSDTCPWVLPYTNKQRWKTGNRLKPELRSIVGTTVNQHPPTHHPLDACYYSVMDEPQQS
jgi:hypothetical protein